jgi:hypothetical protein
MNTKALIGLVVIILIGAGAYMVWGRGGGYGPVSTVPVGGGSNSLQQLVAAGAPVTCTFSTTTASGGETGTIYIANGMVAGDFTVTDSKAGAINAHMITRDQTSYTWTSMSNQGFKSTINASNSPGQTQGQGVDYSAQMDYSCQAWTPDSSKFNLPANISFIATASYVPPPQGAGATGAGTVTPGGGTTGAPPVAGTAEQCAACNQLSGAQKAQCLAALNCQ